MYIAPRKHIKIVMRRVFRGLFWLLILSNASLYAQMDSVLFMGNSYTHGNGVPMLFDKLARSVGDTFYVESITKGGYTLDSHVNDPNHIAKLTQRKWSFVFLQDQSQVPTIDLYFNALSLPSALILDSYVRSQNSCAKTLFFMTWGRRFGGQQCDLGNANCSVAFTDFNHMQDTLKSRYRQLAQHIDGGVSPAGEAWRLALQDTTGLVLHAGDGSHANLMGSYLAACTHYASVTGKSPMGASYTAGISATWARYLQRKAAEAVLDSMEVYFIDGPVFPGFEMEAHGLLDIAQPSCQTTQLKVLTQLQYVGKKANRSNLELALNQYDISGGFLRSDPLSFHCPPRCTDTLLSLLDTISLDSQFYFLVLDKLDSLDSGFSFFPDTLAAFTRDLSVWDSASEYLEPFTIKENTASHDLWKAELDFLSGQGWRLEADASVELAQAPIEPKGSALLTLGAGGSPKWLISPCIELQSGHQYEIGFSHSNHRMEGQSGLGFQLAMAMDEEFLNLVLIHDFGIRYDSLFTQFIDTIQVDSNGRYFFGVEAVETMGPGLIGKMAIDDFHLRNLGEKADSISSIAGGNVPNDVEVLSLYPNPAHTELHIKLHQALPPGSTLSFIDMLGHKLSAKLPEQGPLTFDLSHLNPGIYTLLLEIDGKIICAKKFAVVRR